MEKIEHIAALEAISRQLDLTEEVQTQHFNQMLDHARQYLGSIETAPVYNDKFDATKFVKEGMIRQDGMELPDVLSQLHEHVDTVGVNPTSGRFVGYIPGGGLVHSAIGDFLAAIANRYAGYYSAGPGAATVENIVLQWVGKLFDYPTSASGYLASGGSIANLTAIVTARDAHQVQGAHIEKHVVYLTDQVHHCIDKALHIAGISSCVKRIVPVDRYHRMDAGQLEAQILADKKAGLNPFLVIASAGTTNTGSVDPLASIGQIAQAHGLWYHIDGAYGGLFKLCPEGAEILDGTAYSDSIVVDPHKTLFLPYGTGIVLIKDTQKMLSSFSANADYLDNDDGTVISSADLSPELTKHFRGLRMWLPLKIFGTDVFSAALSEKIHLARYFHQEMMQSGGFEVGDHPDLSVVTYRYLPQRGDADVFNERLMKAVNADGGAFLSSTRLHGRLTLRAAIMSFRTHLEDVDAIIDLLRFYATQLAKS